MADDQDLVRWSEALSGIARTGLAFTTSLYEQERFQEILNVAADMRAAVAEERPASEWAGEWMKAVGKGVPGYVTPKLAVGAVVGNEKGELLLIQRADSGVWLYPTGWCDMGYSPAEVVVKEVHEETGIDVEPVRIIAVIDGVRNQFTACRCTRWCSSAASSAANCDRIRSRRATSASSPAIRCRSRWSASTVGATRPSRRSTGTRSRSCSTRRATPYGRATPLDGYTDSMRFRRGAQLDTSQVSDRRGMGPLAIGGGGIVGVIFLVIQLLGGGDPSGLQLGQGQDGRSDLSVSCTTGEDANQRDDCRIVGVINSVQEFWQSELDGYRAAKTVFFTRCEHRVRQRVLRRRPVLLPARPADLHRPRLLRRTAVAVWRQRRSLRRGVRDRT